MKKNILIVTVLISNIAFGSVLPGQIRDGKEFSTQKTRVNSIHKAASINLSKRGLDESIAMDKVSEILKADEFTNVLMAQNIVMNFNELKHEDIISYISDSALYGKSVDLSSYSNIVALIQKSNNFNLDKTTLKKIEKIVLENKNIKSLYSV